MTTARLACLVVAFLLLGALNTSDAEPTIGVQITFENELTNDNREFKATSHIDTIRKSTYEILRDLEAKCNTFRFTTKEHKDYGHFVTHVHGIGADWDNDRTYWAFLKRTDDVDCLIPMGISSYIPSDGEHIVLSLVKSPNSIVSCSALGKPTTQATKYRIRVHTGNGGTDDVSLKICTSSACSKSTLLSGPFGPKTTKTFYVTIDDVFTLKKIKLTLATQDPVWLLHRVYVYNRGSKKNYVCLCCNICVVTGSRTLYCYPD